MAISKESALAWVSKKLVNPDTGKTIKKNGPKYKEFLEAATNYGLPLSVKVFKKTFPKTNEDLDFLFISHGTYIEDATKIDYSPQKISWPGQKIHRTPEGFTIRTEKGFRIIFSLDPFTGKVTVSYDPDNKTNYWKPIGVRLGKIMEKYQVMDS